MPSLLHSYRSLVVKLAGSTLPLLKMLPPLLQLHPLRQPTWLHWREQSERRLLRPLPPRRRLVQQRRRLLLPALAVALAAEKYPWESPIAWWKVSLFLLGLCLRLTARRRKVMQTGPPTCLFTAFDATYTTLLGRYRQEPGTLYCSRSGRVSRVIAIVLRQCCMNWCAGPDVKWQDEPCRVLGGTDRAPVHAHQQSRAHRPSRVFGHIRA